MNRWFRHLARSLKVMRLYRDENDVTIRLREEMAAQLLELIAEGPLEFRVSAGEISLDEEAVVKVPKRKPGVDHMPAPEEELPFLIYKDGIRVLRILRDMPHTEACTLIEALRAAGVGPSTEDDLITLLWQSNLKHVQVESVPLEQTIYLSSRRSETTGNGGTRGHGFVWSPGGSEIHADLGQVTGPQGLHRDTFDDWELPETPVDPVEAYMELLPEMEAARERFQIEWVQEWLGDWSLEAPGILRTVLALDDRLDVRRALAHFVVNWVASAYQNRDWAQTQRALELLGEIDPTGRLSGFELASALEGLDAELLAEQLDTAAPEDQQRFLALSVAIGLPALKPVGAVMARARRGRLRAATCTALSYLCGDDPQLLRPYLDDMRWFVVRNAVFVLGQIGGDGVVDLLRGVSLHPDARVQRAVVLALGSVSREARTPIILNMLRTPDPQLLAGALNMLSRDPSPTVVRAILDCISAPDFETRHEESQRAMFSALAEIGDDGMVDELAEILHRGGWFARLTIQRIGAARTLQRLGTERALDVLEQGLRSKSEAVRAACLEAMDARGAA